MFLNWSVPRRIATKKRRVIFYRDYRGLTGGHIKIRDYYDHLTNSSHYDPFIYIASSSMADHLWRFEANVVASYEPDKYDLIFIAGMDWEALNAFPDIETRIPVVNLVQGVRHAAPSDPRYQYLGRRAVRICVSSAVARSLHATGRCEGPIHVVPLGIGSIDMPRIRNATTQVFIAGAKRPKIAVELANTLRQRGFRVDCLTTRIERAQFLNRLAAARIVVTLPLAEEGFFMPALEAMLCGRAVICPDCVGNRDFCIERITALMPQCEPRVLADAVQELIDDPQLERNLVSAAAMVARKHSLTRERRSFLGILDTVQ